MHLQLGFLFYYCQWDKIMIEHSDFVYLMEHPDDTVHSEYYIRQAMRYSYTREEAINILDGKNPDGSSFIPLPF